MFKFNFFSNTRKAAVSRPALSGAGLPVLVRAAALSRQGSPAEAPARPLMPIAPKAPQAEVPREDGPENRSLKAIQTLNLTSQQLLEIKAQDKIRFLFQAGSNRQDLANYLDQPDKMQLMSHSAIQAGQARQFAFLLRLHQLMQESRVSPAQLRPLFSEYLLSDAPQPIPLSGPLRQNAEFACRSGNLAAMLYSLFMVAASVKSAFDCHVLPLMQI